MRSLIVDGYNVIRQTPPYRDISETDLEAARLALLSDVSAFAHGDYRATVVFDGHLNPESKGIPHVVGGVTVIFSRFGMDADTVIESLARTARENGDEAVVVTSDAQTQWTVLGGRIARMSSAEFAGEISADQAEWRDHAPSGSSRGLIEDRIDADVRRKLARWARGKE